MLTVLNKTLFIDEAAKFMINYANILDPNYNSLDVDTNYLEYCVNNFLDDEDVRKFLIFSVEQRLNLLNSVANKIDECEKNTKNFALINFTYYFTHCIRPCIKMLDRLQDYTGFHGEHKDIQIMLKDIRDLKNIYNIDIPYNIHGINRVTDYVKELSVNDRTSLYTIPQVKYQKDYEVKLYLASMYSCNMKKDKRYQEIYSNLYYKQVDDLDYKSASAYQNLLVGNIGEQIVLEELSDKNPYYVSANIGDYAGYDIYYYDTEEQKEKLIEAKATVYFNYDSGDDSFYIGDTEIPKLESTLEDPKVDYIVKRVFITFDQKGIKDYNITTLVPQDKETLIDEDGNIYKLKTDDDNKKYFYCEQLKRKNKLVRN